jgi:hypothetical protein
VCLTLASVVSFAIKAQEFDFVLAKCSVVSWVTNTFDVARGLVTEKQERRMNELILMIARDGFTAVGTEIISHFKSPFLSGWAHLGTSWEGVQFSVWPPCDVTVQNKRRSSTELWTTFFPSILAFTTFL